MAQVLLIGLDGGNPLAFLAALGAFRMATNLWPLGDVRMSWNFTEGAWRPSLLRVPDEANLSTEIATHLRGSTKPFELSKKFPFKAALLREQAINAQKSARPTDRMLADFLAAYGCEALVDGAGNFADTAFRMLRTADSAGSGMLDYAKKLVRSAGCPEIERSLFSEWSYADDRPSLRWDPADDRRYALRAADPSTDAIRTERGANRLAIEALPLFPVAPVGGRLATTGFTGTNSQNTFLTWPIWSPPIGLDTVRSLLALEELQASSPDRARLLAFGIAEIYRSQRITVGKYRNFTPAQPV